MSEWAETRTFQLSRRLSVEMTVGPGGFVCEWSPDMPERLTPKEWKRYRAARHSMLTALAERLGGPVVCLEL